MLWDTGTRDTRRCRACVHLHHLITSCFSAMATMATTRHLTECLRDRLIPHNWDVKTAIVFAVSLVGIANCIGWGVIFLLLHVWWPGMIFLCLTPLFTFVALHVWFTATADLGLRIIGWTIVASGLLNMLSFGGSPHGSYLHMYLGPILCATQSSRAGHVQVVLILILAVLMMILEQVQAPSRHGLSLSAVVVPSPPACPTLSAAQRCPHRVINRDPDVT